MLETPRLRLTCMGTTHQRGLSEMNADPEVMVHFPAVMTHAQSAAHLARMQAHWAAHSFGLFAMHHKESGAFLGFTGLTHPGYETPFTPCVEVGWRLHRSAWGKGYALEAAHACLNWGFATLKLSEIVSFTARENLRSIALMQRLKMQRNPCEDFEHPMLPLGHPLSWHVLYRISKPPAAPDCG
ncbi:MAG: GNAT family N-acetyltransferase [Rhodobacteraceae bacterium]|nr:GNAT family N-acetyltransferase [Paracoccaceae bacterium]